ncbi:MAG: hypothetical protein NVSMB14_13720 [Isosphaeraceae bacterium]
MMYSKRKPRAKLGVGFVAGMIGIAFGWILFSPGAPILRAVGGADRFDEWVVTTGPIGITYAESPPNPSLGGKAVTIPVLQEAVYYLNYQSGYLLAAVPMGSGNVMGKGKVLGEFAERDLVADFDLSPNSKPHFVMSAVSTTEGWAPLIVIETRSGKVATYRCMAQLMPGSNRPRFDLLEIRSLRRPNPPSKPVGR